MCHAGVHVAVSMGGSMSGALMTKEYLPFVWRSRPGQLFREQAVLLMDAHAYHKDPKVIAALQARYETSTLLIPPGMTPLLQPLDVEINKVIKIQVAALMSTQLLSGINYSESQNMLIYMLYHNAE